MHRQERYYLFIATAFSVIFVLSNVIAAKIFRVPFTEGYSLPVGLITYPLTFLVTDTVTEIWGGKRARLMILLALAMNLLSLVIIQLSIRLPPDPVWVVEGNFFGYTDLVAYQNAYESVFGVNSLLVTGSLISYLVTQLLDVRIFSRIRELTGSKHLWLRNNVSTLFSQAVDTMIMGSTYFFLAMGMSVEVALPLMLGIYLYKVIFSLCDTPFLYLAVGLLRRRLNRSQYEAPLATFSLSTSSYPLFSKFGSSAIRPLL